MVAVATSVFQRNGGRWCAQYKHDGKHKQVSAKTKEEVVKKRQAIIEALNHQISSASEQENLMLESKSETEENQHHELLVCEKNDDEGAIRPNEKNDDEGAIRPNEKNDDEEAIRANEKHENAINRITLGNWLFEWLELYAKEKTGYSTYEGYKVYVNKHIIPFLGDVDLQSLSPNVLQNFFETKAINGRLDRKQGGMSPKSISNMRFMLNSAMKQAQENGLIAENPVSQIKLHKLNKDEAKALTPEEQECLTEACRNYRNLSAFGIILALRTGIQLCELLALRWSDIDFCNKEIHIRQKVIRHKSDNKLTWGISALDYERTIGEPVVFEDFFDALNTYINAQQSFFGYVPDYVIANQNGTLFDPRNYSKVFQQITTKIGVLNAGFDILRNTFAVQYLKQNLDVKELPRILGYVEGTRTISKYRRLYER